MKTVLFVDLKGPETYTLLYALPVFLKYGTLQLCLVYKTIGSMTSDRIMVAATNANK